MNKYLMVTAIAIFSSGAALADTYSITVTNDLDDELLAPIVITSAENDSHFFSESYVTKAAETQILTGDPGEIVKSIGETMATVGHGNDGPPGVLLAPGDSLSFEVETDATSLRILAMVAPTMVPDNYVTNVVDIHASDEITATLNRFDIGQDEGRMSNKMVSDGGATVMINRK